MITAGVHDATRTHTLVLREMLLVFGFKPNSRRMIERKFMRRKKKDTALRGRRRKVDLTDVHEKARISAYMCGRRGSDQMRRGRKCWALSRDLAAAMSEPSGL